MWILQYLYGTVPLNWRTRGLQLLVSLEGRRGLRRELREEGARGRNGREIEEGREGLQVKEVDDGWEDDGEEGERWAETRDT